MLTILPDRRSIIGPSSARVSLIGPSMLMSTTRSQNPASLSTKGCPLPKPAPFTSTCTSPRPSTNFAKAAMDSSDATSICMKLAARPPLRSRSASCSPLSAERSAMMTCAPARARISAVARPIPDAAPVTTAVLPSSLMFEPSFVEKCLDPVASIGGVEQFVGLQQFDQHAGANLGIHRAEAVLAGGERRRRQGRDPVGNAIGESGQLIVGHRPLHQPEISGLSAGDDFGHQNKAAGNARTCQARQPLRAARTRQQTKAGLRQTERSAFGRNTQITGKRQFKPAALRGAADLGNDDLRQGFDAIKKTLHPPDRLDHAAWTIFGGKTIAHQFEVSARRKNAQRRTDQQDGDIRLP